MVGPRRLRALYFTRATAPHGDGPRYHHIGLYAYRRAALERFVRLPPSPLEQQEKLEQLRALEAGMRIDIGIVDTVPRGVDTPADLEDHPPDTGQILNGWTQGAMTKSEDHENRIPGRAGRRPPISPIAEAYPDAEALPCPTFEDALAAISSGEADLGMIPIENSVAGRVADIHHLLPQSGLFIVGEWFLPVHHQSDGAARRENRRHQDRRKPRPRTRTMPAHHPQARHQADRRRRHRRQRSHHRRARRQNLRVDCLQTRGRNLRPRHPRRGRRGRSHNTTRFVVLAREAAWAEQGAGPLVTTFVFRVRNLPAALYKAMGGFATNGVNMTKLESYMVDGNFFATQFYADVDGHPDDRGLAFALEELKFFSRELRVVGVYPAHPFRATFSETQDWYALTLPLCSIARTRPRSGCRTSCAPRDRRSR